MSQRQSQNTLHHSVRQCREIQLASLSRLESVQRIGNIHRRDQEEILMLALQCFRELGRAGRAPDSLVASDVEIRREPHSSLLWALGTLAFTTVTFLALYIVRFSGIGIWLVKFVFLGLLGTVLFSIRDFCRSKTRGRSFLAFLLCLSVLMFFGLLTVWGRAAVRVSRWFVHARISGRWCVRISRHRDLWARAFERGVARRRHRSDWEL